MEGVEPALQKKYHKITGIPRGLSSNNSIESQLSHVTSNKSENSDVESNSKVSVIESGPLDMNASIKPFPTLLQQATQVLGKSHEKNAIFLSSRSLSPTQPLNLTSDSIKEPTNQKRSLGSDAMNLQANQVTNYMEPNVVTHNTFYENHHPQNPERSIIKSLLLNSRGLAVPTTGEGEDAIYTCPLCKISFRSADNLQYHTKCYCQGTPPVSIQQNNQINGSPHSAPISPVGSPSHKYFRSNSFNLYLPEKYSPNTLKKLATSTLRHHRTPLSLAKLAAQQYAGYYSNKAMGSSSLPMCSSISAIGEIHLFFLFKKILSFDMLKVVANKRK